MADKWVGPNDTRILSVDWEGYTMTEAEAASLRDTTHRNRPTVPKLADK